MPSDEPAAMEVDHYAILGLPSGVQGAKVSHENIIKAYKLKALKLHPDKRRDDPDAHKNFLRLRNSYDILKNIQSRKAYDDVVRVKHEKIIQDLKYREMMDTNRKKAEEVMKRARDEMKRKMMDDYKKEKELQQAMKKAWDEKERKMMDDLKKEKELVMKKVRDETKRKCQEIMDDLEKKSVLAVKKVLDEIARKHTEMMDILMKQKEVAEKKARDEMDRKHQAMMADHKKERELAEKAALEKERKRRKMMHD